MVVNFIAAANGLRQFVSDKVLKAGEGTEKLRLFTDDRCPFAHGRSHGVEAGGLGSRSDGTGEHAAKSIRIENTGFFPYNGGGAANLR